MVTIKTDTDRTAPASRGGGSGASIRFAADECPLGTALVATTEEGVCAILFGDRTEARGGAPQGRFPKARREVAP